MNTQSMLKALEKIGRSTNSLLNILIGGHAQWHQKMKKRVFYPTMPDFPGPKDNQQFLEREKHRFYSLLYQLKKQGFIKKKQKMNKSYWVITDLGRQNVNKLKSAFHPSRPSYRKEKDSELNVLIFDIPEKERFKRNWLRQVLLGLDFAMLQKSVWIGKNKLPEEFLKDLDGLKLMNYIHIFKVTKTGTIEKH